MLCFDKIESFLRYCTLQTDVLQYRVKIKLVWNIQLLQYNTLVLKLCGFFLTYLYSHDFQFHNPEWASITEVQYAIPWQSSEKSVASNSSLTFYLPLLPKKSKLTLTQRQEGGKIQSEIHRHPILPSVLTNRADTYAKVMFPCRAVEMQIFNGESESVCFPQLRLLQQIQYTNFGKLWENNMHDTVIRHRTAYAAVGSRQIS